MVTTGAGYLVWRSYRDAQSFDALLRQLDIAAKGDPAPVCVPEDSSLYAASKAVSDIGAHLQESVAAQMKSERMKLDLITNVSHDLKTPLTSIIGYLDLLEKQDDLPAGTRDYVLILRQKSERLATTVADLFTLAKATSGSEALAIEPLDLVMAVRQTLGDMNDSIRHTGVPVKATMPESAIVQADSGKLYRVLQNILDNALRYSLVGTRIYLEVSRGDIATRLTLTNTASYEMNFAPDDVLQRFVRGDASRTTEGSGLGLSIAQSFMQNFGGGLEVGVQGDTFTVTLTFPGSAAAGNGAAPAVRMEVFGTAETCGENDGGDTEHAAEPDALPCTPADVSGADANKACGACAAAPETPEPCGVSTGIPDTAPVPKAPAGTPGAVETHTPPAGRTVRTAVPRTAKLRPFPIKRPQPPLLRLKQPRRRNQKSRRLRKACRLLKQRKTAAPPPPFPLPGGGTVGVKALSRRIRSTRRKSGAAYPDRICGSAWSIRFRNFASRRALTLRPLLPDGPPAGGPEHTQARPCTRPAQ